VTDVARDIAYVMDAFAPLAAEKGARVVSTVSETATAAVESQALRQILLNFLENAVKYGPHGQTITLGCEEFPGGIRLWVSDEGPGVPENERESIWLAFRRGSAARESAAVGSGIGLSVVRDLATRHGGRAYVEAEPTGGARFVVEFASAEDVAERVDVRR
jgi:signal transduction histidine kinase